MAILKIYKYPAEELRVACEKVQHINQDLLRLIDDMTETMYAASGVGLAASQVGSKLRVVVLDIGDGLYQLINPKIVKKEGTVASKEGCLSVPQVSEFIHRADRITVESLDRDGKTQTIEATGRLSNCLQHEIDHLDGVLFIDHLNRARRRKVSKKLKK